MKQGPLLGAHMSIAGGIHNAFLRGTKVGCRTLQIFLKNSAQWRSRKLTEEDRARYREAQRKSGIRPVVAHSSYLINLASPDRSLHARSLEGFIEELERANFLNVPFLVLHPGAHMGMGEKEGIGRIARSLNCALERVPPPIRILLENTAGQGSSIGHRFEQLAEILDLVRNSDRIGFCLDTCHTFAAGYNIRTAEGYGRTIGEFQRLIGSDRIFAFHLNDCKKELGSRVDRHAHIGQGFIGVGTFRWLINDRRFRNVPKILETPKGKELQEDIMNLTLLRRLFVR